MSNEYINFFFAFFGIAVVISAFCGLLILQQLEHIDFRYMLCLFGCVSVFLISIIMENAFLTVSGMWVHIILEFIEFFQYLSLNLFGFFIFLNFYHMVKNVPAAVHIRNIMYFLAAFGLTLLIINVFNHMYYRIDSCNMYVRGDWFLLSQAVAFLEVVILLVYMFQVRLYVDRKIWLSMLMIIVFPSLMEILQVFRPGLNYVALGTVLDCLYIYICLLYEWQKILKRKNRELRHVQASLNLSQLDPDSLKVSLTAVTALCKKDPRAASKLVDTFADYMRTSFNKMGDLTWQPLTDEITQLNRYLDVAGARLGDRIHLEFDLEKEGFFLPALILQQMMERLFDFLADNIDFSGIKLLTVSAPKETFHFSGKRHAVIGLKKIFSSGPIAVGSVQNLVILHVVSDKEHPFRQKDEAEAVFRDILVRIAAIDGADFMIEYVGDDEINFKLILEENPPQRIV